MRLKDSIQKTILPNGLTVISDYYDRPADDAYRGMMAATIVVHRGSLHDPAGKNGLAHFAEHMMYHALHDMPRRELLKRLTSLGLQSHNLGTGLQDTQYYAQGRQSGVEACMNLVARMMTEGAYTQTTVDKERGRIINEMKDVLTSLGRLHAHQFNRAVYGEQAHGQWTGGLPKDMAEFTLDDIKNYHARAHATGNLCLITSGGWQHDQACAWADQHLSSLPEGARLEKLRSVPQNGRVFFKNPFLYHPEAGQMVTYRLHLGIEDLSPPEREATLLANRILWDSLQQFGEDLDVYSIGASQRNPGSDDLRDHKTTSYGGSKVEIERLRPLLHTIIAHTRQTIERMDPDKFEEAKALSVQGIEDYFRMNISNPFERQDAILSNYLNGTPLTYWEDRLGVVRNLTREQVRETALRVYGQEPIPSYVAAEEFDFPTGPELQRVWHGAGPSPQPSGIRAQPGPAI